MSIDEAMKFIIEQQAQLVINQQKAEERTSRLENILVRSHQNNETRFENIESKLDALADAQIRLTDAQTRTDDSLRNLIAIVDRYFSNGRDEQN